MYPAGHLALGYLAGVGVARASGRRRPRFRQELLPLWIGALLPDLVDKPAYLLGAAEATRWMGHSPAFVLLLWGLWVALYLRAARPSLAGFPTGAASARPARPTPARHPRPTPARPLALLTLGVISHQAADLVDGAVSGLLYSGSNLISTWFTWPVAPVDRWVVELDGALLPFRAPITPLELLVVAAALAVAWRLRGNFQAPPREQPRNPSDTHVSGPSRSGRPPSEISSS